MDKKVINIIRKHALLNALNFGKADSSRMFGRVIGEMPELKNDMNSLKKAVNEIVNEVNKLSKDRIEAELKKDAPEMLEKKEAEKKELHELKGIAKGKKVVMRFAPSPSGPLHVGHSYVLGLNSEYCRLYKGKLILRIEDTNPANIDTYAYTQIPEDAKWLTKGNVSEVVIQSDNVENYYDHALTMIEKGFVYVCTCPAEEFKKISLKKEECPCRKNKVAENLKRWKMMFNADEYEEGDAVLRFKTDMAHKNPAMRDFPLMRINDEEHPRTGKKYRVWPLMNFSVACDDNDYGITHCLRGKDHADNAKRQEFIQKAMGWDVPQTIFVGRINFKGMSVSCSETKQLINEGKYSGWDDIRLPFLIALKRRGYIPEAFIKYALSIGVTLNDKSVDKEEFFKALNAFNKDFIDSISYRYFFVWDPVEIAIKGAPEQEIELDLHPKKKEGGRAFNTKDRFYISKEDLDSIKDRRLYRLMDCLNFRKEKGTKGISFVFDSLEYDQFKEKGDRIIHWLPVPKNAKSLVNVEVVMDENDAIKTVKGLGEEHMRNIKEGQTVQLERFGFCRLDEIRNDTLVFWFGHR